MLNQPMPGGWRNNGESLCAKQACCTYLVAGPLERTPPLLLHLYVHTSVECEGRLPTEL